MVTREEVEAKTKLRIKLKSYDHKVIDNTCRSIIELAKRSNVETTGPIPLPSEVHKYTVLRSSFVHKDSREQYEMRVHKRLIEVYNPTTKFIEALKDLNLPAGVEIEIKT